MHKTSIRCSSRVAFAVQVNNWLDFMMKEWWNILERARTLWAYAYVGASRKVFSLLLAYSVCQAMSWAQSTNLFISTHWFLIDNMWYWFTLNAGRNKASSTMRYQEREKIRRRCAHVLFLIQLQRTDICRVAKMAEGHVRSRASSNDRCSWSRAWALVTKSRCAALGRDRSGGNAGAMETGA